MYDSDEVRDAVHRDMLRAMTVKGGMDGTSHMEWAALQDAYNTKIAATVAFWAQVEAALKEFAAAVREWAEAVGRAMIEGLGRVARSTIESLKELAEQIGILEEMGHTPPPWADRSPLRWPRKPEIRPVRLVDAVAAGRHPALLFRARQVGGRR